MITPDDFFKQMGSPDAPREWALEEIRAHIDNTIVKAADKKLRGDIIIPVMPAMSWTEAEVDVVLNEYSRAGWEVRKLVTAMCALSVPVTRG